MDTTNAPPADWYPDPSGRHHYRYWDGGRWTDYAATDGVQVTDAIPARTATVTTAEPTRRSLRTRPVAQQPGEQADEILVYSLVGADGYCNTEVAGEFARIEAIHRLIGRKPRLNEEIVLDDLRAALIPELTNRHDPTAVMVVINAHHVGYLERDIAASINRSCKG